MNGAALADQLNADLSVEQRVALLPRPLRMQVLASLELHTLAYDWAWTRRPSQFIPVLPADGGENFSTMALLSGRGGGKTRAGGEWVRDLDRHWSKLGRAVGPLRVALVGRTAGDVRDTMLQGESGLLNIYPPSEQDKISYVASRRSVILPNGAMCLLASAEEPDQLRGPQFHISWCDEVAAWKQVRGQGNLDAWGQAQIATRLGTRPQLLVTTTPKRVPSVRKLIADAAVNPLVQVRRGKTTDNKHLAQAYLDVVLGLYAGTALGRQELDGEMLDDVEGAMTTQAVLDAYRVDKLPGGVPWMKVIGVDPSVASKPHDECGIVVVYITQTHPVLKRHAYIVDDLSGRMSPAVWGERVVRAAHEHGATVVAEVNQGMALVKQNVMQAAAKLNVAPPPFRATFASKAKAVRAEPIGAAAEQGRLHVVGSFPELEDQMTAWVSGDSYSPDRMDGMVHGAASGLFPMALVNGTPGSATTHVPKGRVDTTRIASRDQRQRPRIPGALEATRIPVGFRR